MDTDDFSDAAVILLNSLGLSFIAYMDIYHFDDFIANLDMAWPFFAAFVLAFAGGIYVWVRLFRTQLGILGSIFGLCLLTGFWLAIYEISGVFKLPQTV